MSEGRGLPFDEPAPRGRPVLTVTELSARLKSAIESRFGAVVVEGEISNCRQWTSGHVYFTLKDDHAQIRAVLFRATAERLRFAPEDGLHVVARGRVSVYEVKGEYQLVVDALDPHGLGALQAAFEQLKRRLQAEGLFERTRKRELPVLPRRIGIVTSQDGAAIRDILRVLLGRHPTARVVVRPAKVQGFGAQQDLVRAIRAIARVPEVDVVIVARGGGSVEDLWSFNDEGLARAIAACPVPVITGIGHEVDFTIADFVADVRAATPSNAAELVVDRADNFRTRIERAADRLRRAVGAAMQRLQSRRDRVDLRLRHWPVAVVMRDRDRQELQLRLSRAAARRVARLGQRVEALDRRLARRDVRHVTAELQTRLVRADGRLAASMRRRWLAAGARARHLAGQLDAMSPLAVLGRGYAVCWNETRTSIIRSSTAVEPGRGVRVTLADGELACRVESTAPRDAPHVRHDP
jgi:exodeoxyribonuclease VII large subunit